MIFCPACGTENDDDSQFCKKCGRSLDDAKQARKATNPPTGNAVADSEGRVLADDGLPVGEDLDGVPGGERHIWSGRPSKLLSPIRAITRRYKLTNERLQIDSGFVGRQHQEIDLYRVQDVEVRQGVLQRSLDKGDIWVFSSDRSDDFIKLANVSDPMRAKDLIRHASRLERQRRRVLLRDEV